MSTRADDESSDWSYVASRWLEYEGEMRVALLRVIFVAAFYATQLVHFLVFSDRSPAVEQFHRQATYLAAAWLFISLAVLVALSRQFFPAWLKYVTAAFDLTLLTVMAAMGSGPASPLVFVYGVLIALAGLRGSLALIWSVTLGTMLAYLFLVGLRDDSWFDATHSTPPIQQMVVHLSLVATGIIVGQLVRMMRQVIAETLARQQTRAVNQGGRS
jgi:hypothetical protein